MLRKFIPALFLILATAGVGADDGTIDLRIDPATGTIINTPGSYRLVGDVTLTTTVSNGITINVDNVTLDLGGHIIRASAAATSGAGINASAGDEFTVMNGAVIGFPFSGISAGDGAVVRDVRLEGNNKAGGLFVMGLGDNSIVERCLVRNNIAASGSMTGINVGTSSRVVGNTVENNDTANNAAVGIRALLGACEILDNIVRGNTGSTTSGGVHCIGIEANSARNIIRGNNVTDNDNNGVGGGFGIRGGTGNLITGNVCAEHTLGATAIGDFVGIEANLTSLVEGNVCSGNTGGGGVGSDCTGIQGSASTSIIGNTCSFNAALADNVARGIRAAGSNLLIKDNLCSANSATGAAAKVRGIEIASNQCTVVGNTCAGNLGTGATIIAEAFGIVVTGDFNLIQGNQTNGNNPATTSGGIHIEAGATGNRIQENITRELNIDIQNDGGGTNIIPAAGNHLENIAF